MPLPPPHPPDKSALRRQLRVRRDAIDARIRRCAGRALIRYALREHLLARGKRAGFYLPTKSEINVLPLFHVARAMGAHCYLPVVPARGQRKLWFTRPDTRAGWVTNRFGIPEYRRPGARYLRASKLDLLFMPLIGFDAHGGRIGMGGGYYDASLAFLAVRRVWRRPRLIGVAFSAQEVEYIPLDPWDIPLDGILTESGFRWAR